MLGQKVGEEKCEKRTKRTTVFLFYINMFLSFGGQRRRFVLMVSGRLRKVYGRFLVFWGFGSKDIFLLVLFLIVFLFFLRVSNGFMVADGFDKPDFLVASAEKERPLPRHEGSYSPFWVDLRSCFAARGWP